MGWTFPQLSQLREQINGYKQLLQRHKEGVKEGLDPLGIEKVAERMQEQQQEMLEFYNSRLRDNMVSGRLTA